MILDDPAFLFRLAVLAHSLNAAWSGLRLLETVYPRFALSHARHLREGDIAMLWGKAFPEESRSLLEASPAGGRVKPNSWPKSGKMANEVQERLKAETPDDQNAANWSTLMRTLGDTHNYAFSHAVSEYSMGDILAAKDETFAPRVGPSHDEDAVAEAIDHMVPLLAFMLRDSQPSWQIWPHSSPPSTLWT